MGIKYFYDFCLTVYDNTDLSSDILAEVRRSFFDSGKRIRDRITVDSQGEALFYEYTLEKDKPLKWTVKDPAGTVLQEVVAAEDGRYRLCFYKDQALVKRMLFSKLHTLLRVEYIDASGTVCASIEPRKARRGLCLLYTDTKLPEPVILSEAPEVPDENTAKKVSDGFTDHSAVAATNEGIVYYLSPYQEATFRAFVRQTEQELIDEAKECFVDESPLFDKINVKDFNVKRNLSSALDITKAAAFGETPSDEVVEPEIEADIEETEIAETYEEIPEITEEEAVSMTVKPDKEIIADGAVYSYYGELDGNGERSGYGRTVTDLGTTAYEGQYLHDKRSGKGSYFYKDGTLCYTGDWVENARHGVGIGISARDGSMHVGRWSNNKPEGNGVRITADGNVRFVCKELSDGGTVLMNHQDDDTILISKYDDQGKKIAEKLVSLTDFE